MKIPPSIFAAQRGRLEAPPLALGPPAPPLHHRSAPHPLLQLRIMSVFSMCLPPLLIYIYIYIL